MAAPAEKTLKDLSGKWTLNKSLSDDLDPLFQLQSLSWFLRTTIAYATVTLHVSQYTSPPPTTPTNASAPPDNAITHIDIENHLTAGLRGSPERRTLDWTWRDHADAIFGPVRGRSRFVDPAALAAPAEKAGGTKDEEWADEVAFLTKDWDAAAFNEGKVFQSYVESTAAPGAGGGWVANQTWGFHAISGAGDEEGRRRYVRHVVVRKGEEVRRAVLVYDWIGPLDAPAGGQKEGKAAEEDDGLAYE